MKELNHSNNLTVRRLNTSELHLNKRGTQVLSNEFAEGISNIPNLQFFYISWLVIINLIVIPMTAWKVSVFGVVLVRIFPAFGLNTESYGESLCIRSECRKIRTRKTPNTGTFYAVNDYDGNKAKFKVSASNLNAIRFSVSRSHEILISSWSQERN